MKTLKLRAYYWNPNGTNDLEIIDASTGETVDSLQEACFGIPMHGASKIIQVRTAMKHIACSPVSDGSEVINFLSKYFPKHFNR